MGCQFSKDTYSCLSKPAIVNFVTICLRSLRINIKHLLAKDGAAGTGDDWFLRWRIGCAIYRAHGLIGIGRIALLQRSMSICIFVFRSVISVTVAVTSTIKAHRARQTLLWHIGSRLHILACNHAFKTAYSRRSQHWKGIGSQTQIWESEKLPATSNCCWLVRSISEKKVEGPMASFWSIVPVFF